MPAFLFIGGSMDGKCLDLRDPSFELIFPEHVGSCFTPEGSGPPGIQLQTIKQSRYRFVSFSCPDGKRDGAYVHSDIPDGQVMQHVLRGYSTRVSESSVTLELGMLKRWAASLRDAASYQLPYTARNIAVEMLDLLAQAELAQEGLLR